MGIFSEREEFEHLYQLIRRLESRISRIEAHLNLEPLHPEEAPKTESVASTQPAAEEESLEFKIGQYWFTKIGIIILSIGIAFLMLMPYQNLPPAFPSLMGYLLVAFILGLAHGLRKSYSYVSRFLLGGGLVLLYFTTMRLHFFGSRPAIENTSLILALLLLVVGINLLVAIRRNSVYLTAISLTLGYVTAVVSNQSGFLFGVVSLLAGLTVYFKLKYRWNTLFVYGIVLTYFVHFIWFMNNPFMGNKLQFVSSPSWNLLFLLIYAVVFALGNLFREERDGEDHMVILSTFLNCGGVFFLFLLETVSKFHAHLAFWHLLSSAVFLTLSILFWMREKSKYSTFFYAMLGYTALSVAIIARFQRPDYFLWLCWQSLLVISTAIWFRSKIIVLANFLIFLLIFITYLILAGKVTLISMSFGIVALLSARIMNWQKHRLELKTEFMRNAYLATAFFIFPYALYHTVPGSYVGLSWIGIALFYYILSVVLNNRKYRWMTLGTLLLTVSYVLIIGITRLEPVYRIISFLLLGIVLLIFSLLYARMKPRKTADEE